jgi:hypothetical protein
MRHFASSLLDHSAPDHAGFAWRLAVMRKLVVLAGLGLCASAYSPALAQEGPKPCKGARFKSPWDNSIDVSAIVKAGDSCVITLPLTNVSKATVKKNSKLGKAEPVADTANVTFTPNNSVSGLDRFTYEVERTEGDKPVKQVIRVEVSVLKAKDYPIQNVFKEEPLPPSPFDQANTAETKSDPKADTKTAPK